MVFVLEYTSLDLVVGQRVMKPRCCSQGLLNLVLSIMRSHLVYHDVTSCIVHVLWGRGEVFVLYIFRLLLSIIKSKIVLV